MNNQQFIHHLTNLTTSRFALNQLCDDDFKAFHHRLLSEFDIQSTSNDWHLIGTKGCHLCDEVNHLLSQVNATKTLPNICQLDLTDANDDFLIDTLGLTIPVLLTPKKILCYPFGVMDIFSLVHHRAF
ncbi:glutaredoxin family protein [Moraxella sp. Pampa]|uniref:glutaredoxin family protein n=1 Tax=Moraxella sp. Pampa TaxID=3111978 RepID=UPI002B40AAA8|nr:glutaredoxin family protein [Moraxella sp. Pampa]